MTRSAVYGSAAWRRWKHHTHWASATTDPLGAGNTALLAALPVTPLAFYDVRKNVTATTTVSAWDDIRGSSGFGPTLAGSTHQPAWDAANLLITPNGTSSYLLTATTSLFDPSLAQTTVYVGVVPSGTTGTYAVSLGSSTAVNGPSIGSLGGTSIFGKAAGTNVSTTAAAGTTRRLVFCSQNGGTVGASEAPTIAQQTVTVVNPASSASNHLVVGASAQITNFSAPVVRAVIVLPGAYTTTIRDLFKTWATTYHAAVLF